jgi:adenosylcobinamide kinase/adenosylcobinamide-phosphate guanylyltransferase
LNTKKQGSGVRGQGSETNSKLKTQNSKLIFITGGARSGKSAFALNLADSMGKRKCYLATAQALDSEMEERIAKHKAERA